MTFLPRFSICSISASAAEAYSLVNNRCLTRVSPMAFSVGTIALSNSATELSYAIGGYREPLFHKKV